MSIATDELIGKLAAHAAWRLGYEGGVRADLRFAYLRGVNLSGADLSGVNLSFADLSGVNLSGAYLRGANLSGADLSGADLRGVYLRGVNLSFADLSGANLSGAYLRGANLNGVDLSGAKTLLVDDGRAYALRFWQGRYLAGCRNFDRAEALAHWSDPRHEFPASAALLHAAVLAHQEAS